MTGPQYLGQQDYVTFGKIDAQYGFYNQGLFNLQLNSIATASGTTTLNGISNFWQYFTGTLNQTIILPTTSSSGNAGISFGIVNASTGTLTVKSFGTNTITTVPAGYQAIFTSVSNSIDTAAAWVYTLSAINSSQSIAIGSSPTFAGLTLTNPYIAGAGGLHSFQIFTSGTAATYTKPANVTSILVEVIGGGGGGGGSFGAATTIAAGGGGGSGGYARLFVASAASTYTYTVGAGGAGGTAGANTGSTGGTSTFSASLLQATGGLGGVGNGGATATIASYAIGGAPGAGTNGNINSTGSPGSPGLVALTANISGNGGSSHGGGGVGLTSAPAAGTNASGYGAGGAGGLSTTVSAAGGNGSAGLIVVWEFT
jgi:hypothetical protein